MYAICGYRQVGKDTLIQDLKNKKLKQGHDDIKWVVYALNTQKLHFLLAFVGAPHIKRYSFADALKIKTHEFLKLRDCPAHAFENVKETLLLPDPRYSTEWKTMRGWYIYFGQEERKKDANIWTKIVHDTIQHDQIHDQIHVPIISDFRFQNELVKPNETTTIRLFRKKVLIPPFMPNSNEDSEHNLDSFQTDFLFLPPGMEEFDACIEKHPQYANFAPLLNLCTYS